MSTGSVTLNSKVYEKGLKGVTHVDLKAGNGTLYIDVRKWFKPGNLSEFVSSQKGIMLEINDWKVIIPMIQELISNIDKSA